MNETPLALEVVGSKASLIALEKFAPGEFKTLAADERSFGEPATILLLYTAALVAVPLVIAWAYKYRRGVEIVQMESSTTPGGATHQHTIRIRLTESSPPSAEQLKEIAKITGADLNAIQDSIAKLGQ